MIQFIDFKPKIKEGVFYDTTASSFSELVGDMNQWIQKNAQYSIINMETLLLPNLGASEKATANALRTKENNYWIQVLRVWYTD